MMYLDFNNSSMSMFAFEILPAFNFFKFNNKIVYFFSFYTTVSPLESSSTFYDKRARLASSDDSSQKPKF